MITAKPKKTSTSILSRYLLFHPTLPTTLSGYILFSPSPNPNSVRVRYPDNLNFPNNPALPAPTEIPASDPQTQPHQDSRAASIPVLPLLFDRSGIHSSTLQKLQQMVIRPVPGCAVFAGIHPDENVIKYSSFHAKRRTQRKCKVLHLRLVGPYLFG